MKMRGAFLIVFLVSFPLKAVDQGAAYQKGQAMAGTYKAQAPSSVLNEDIPDFKGENVPEASYSHEHLKEAARYKQDAGKEGSASEILNTTNNERAYFPIKANDPLLKQANEVVANPEKFLGAVRKEEEGEEKIVKSRHWCRTSTSMTVKIEEELVVKPVILKEYVKTGEYINGWPERFYQYWTTSSRPGPHADVKWHYHHEYFDGINWHWSRSETYYNYRLRKGVLDPQTGEVQASNWETVPKEVYDKAEEATGHEGWRSLNPTVEELVARRSCRVVSHDCLEGPQKKTVDGVLVFKPCWKRQTVYECGGDHQNDCEYLQKRGCAQIDSRCVEKAEKGHCLVYENLYECQDKHRVRRGVTLTGDVPYCLDGNCATTGYTANQDLAEVLSKLAIFRDIQNEFDGKSVTVFPGEQKYCDKHTLSFLDCCQKGGGWGESLKLSKCKPVEQEFVKRRDKGHCIYVGTFCVEKLAVIGTCLRKRSHSCCYGGKLARLVQEQGRRQLGIDFGTGENPNCRPLTVQELARLDFSKLDLREIFADLTSKVSPPDPQKVLTQFRQDWQNRLPSSDQETKPDLMDTVKTRKKTLSDKPGQYTLNYQDTHPNPKSEITATEESRVVF